MDDVSKAAAEIAGQEGVTGVVAADEHGNTLAVHGTGSAKAAPFVRSLAVQGAALGSEDDVPIVVLGTTTGTVTISGSATSALAVYKAE